MPYTSTRTVRTIIRSGNGPPRVVTKTYTDGDDDGGVGGGIDFDSGIGGFGGRMKMSFGGGRSSGGGGRSYGGGHDDGGSSYSITQRPTVCGRSTRKEKKNPFAGLTKQSYDQIVQRCKSDGILFEDPEFEAVDNSIFFSKRPPRPFEWKRPHEIVDNPEFVTAGASRFDVQQGELGDCWLLAAVASLTCNSHLLARVVPPEQHFNAPDYCGVFKFHFWHQGDWMEVVVDDRLPTYCGQLVFMHSTEKNEFWSALLEKAYAKLCGSYESLKGGSTSEAMEDFTGGVTESYELGKAPDNLLTIMMKAAGRGSLMGCSIDADPNQLEARLTNGLVMGHAYSITAVKLVAIETPGQSGNIPMVRVRNPWGNEAEWKGAWSDQSREWQFIPEHEKKNIGLTFDDDGEFWMAYRDWVTEFQKLEICNLGPDSLDEDEVNQGKKRWEAEVQHGEWIPRVNAGGCRNYLESFSTNPQYRVTLTDPDDDDDEDKCTMLVGLLQKDRRKKRMEGLDLLTIGYVIYKLKDDGTVGTGPLDQRFFKYNASCAKSPNFINMREICGRFKMEPGTYVIIPSTFEPGQAGDFLLRVFTEKASTSSEMDESTRLSDEQRTVERLQHIDDRNQPGPYPQSDPYANRDPPPLGFDLMVKEEVKRPPCPPIPNFPGFGGYGGYDQYNTGAQPGAPGGAPAPGYQPYPNQGYPGDPSGAPYQGGPGGFNPAYLPNQYNPGAPGTNQYYPNQGQPGYQQPPYPGAAGFQPDQYNYQSSPYQPQLGFGGPLGSTPAAPPYQPYGAPPGAQGQAYSPYQQSDPYSQGMERAQSSSMCMSAPPEAPQPTAEEQAQGQKLRETFKQIAGEDLEIDAYELKDILNSVFTKEFQFDGFSVDVCRSMVAMHDGDLSGKLGFDEFKQLWTDLRRWKGVFKKYDADKSGHLNTYELRGAFRESGFHLSNRTLSTLIMRYSNRKGEIEFDDFVMCAIRLKTMLASFKNLDTEKQGLAAFGVDDFIQTTMYS